MPRSRSIIRYQKTFLDNKNIKLFKMKKEYLRSTHIFNTEEELIAEARKLNDNDADFRQWLSKVNSRKIQPVISSVTGITKRKRRKTRRRRKSTKKRKPRKKKSVKKRKGKSKKKRVRRGRKTRRKVGGSSPSSSIENKKHMFYITEEDAGEPIFKKMIKNGTINFINMSFQMERDNSFVEGFLVLYFSNNPENIEIKLTKKKGRIYGTVKNKFHVMLNDKMVGEFEKNPNRPDGTLILEENKIKINVNLLSSGNKLKGQDTWSGYHPENDSSESFFNPEPLEPGSSVEEVQRRVEKLSRELEASQNEERKQLTSGFGGRDVTGRRVIEL